MRIPVYFVIAFLFLSGCAAPGPLLHTAGSPYYYETKDHHLLRVSKDGTVVDASCVGLEWLRSHWYPPTNLEGREATCEMPKIGEVEWESERGDWNMSGYEIQPVCQPLERTIDVLLRLFPRSNIAIPYSCWNRVWEVPWAPVQITLFYVTLPIRFLYGYLYYYLGG